MAFAGPPGLKEIERKLSSPAPSLEASPGLVDERRAGRLCRYEAREFLWRYSHDSKEELDPVTGELVSKPYGVRQCGRYVRNRSAVALVVVEHEDGTREGGWANLVHCSRVWTCPVCSARIMDARAQLISEACRRWDQHLGVDGAGGKIVLMTFTVRHNRKQALTVVWDAVAWAWSRVAGGKGWQADQAEYGSVVTPKGRRIPWLRVFEVTHGINGWHVHVHALLFVGDDFTDDDAQLLGGRMWERWNRGAVKAGLASGLSSVGLEAHVVHGDPSQALGSYFAKAVFEITGARFKTAGGKVAAGQHQTPWQILGQLVDHWRKREKLSKRARARLLALWYEYEEASKGRRLMGRSRGLWELLDMVGWEKTDEEIAGADLGDNGESVAYRTEIPYELWLALVRSGVAHTEIPFLVERSVGLARSAIEAIRQRLCPESPPLGDPERFDAVRGESGPWVPARWRDHRPDRVYGPLTAEASAGRFAPRPGGVPEVDVSTSADGQDALPPAVVIPYADWLRRRTGREGPLDSDGWL